MNLTDKLVINSSWTSRRTKHKQFASHELNLNANNNTRNINKQNNLIDNIHYKTTNLFKSRSTSLEDEQRTNDKEHVCRHSKNLSDISRIDIQTILSELNSKFFAHKYYTEASSNTLIALNPFKDIAELYSQKVMDFYNKVKFLDNTVPAHIYKHAAVAWNMIKHAHKSHYSNQTILVSGDSGSGKTRSINFIIQYYSYITPATRKSIEIKDILLKTNLILESFGNAKTALNDNSSRFGKYIKLFFCTDTNELVSAKLITYLLEKTRSVNSALNECFNFHIFYQLMFGSNETERSKYMLDHSLLNKNFEKSSIDYKIFYKHKLNQLKLSFKLIDLDVDKIFSVISGIAHLNCCLFDSDLNMSAKTREHLNKAAVLLHFDLNDLTNYLLVHELSITNCHNDLIKIPCNLNQIIMRKNSLIKLVYNELFKYLVKAINAKLRLSIDNRHKCIGLLDIYGFESIHNANSLEQLCINYANEKLQKIFIDSYFKLNKFEYESEFPSENFPIEYSDNLPLLKLIESSHANSLFCLLNEQSILKSHDHVVNEDQLLFKIRQIFAHSSDLIYEPRPNCKNQFFIRHYAGHVGYNTDSLITKNTDHVPDDLLKFVTKSKFLSDIVGDHVHKLSCPGHKKSTVLAKFKKNLDNLIVNLNKTNILYVRCIKPNCDLKSDYFNRELVRNQLESCGIISLLNLSKQGFLYKFDYLSFVHRFRAVCYLKQKWLHEMRRLLVLEDWKNMCAKVMEVSEATAEDYRLGWSKIFLKEQMVQSMDAMVVEANNLAATRIQSKWRAHRHRVLNKSATIIQAWWRLVMTSKCSVRSLYNSSLCVEDSSSSVSLLDSASIQSSNYLIELDIVDEKLNMKKE